MTIIPRADRQVLPPRRTDWTVRNPGPYLVLPSCTRNESERCTRPTGELNSPLRLIPQLREKVNMAKHRPNPRVIARDHQPPTRTNYPRACFFPSSPAAYLTTHLLPSTPPNKQYKADNKQQKMASTPCPIPLHHPSTRHTSAWAHKSTKPSENPSNSYSRRQKSPW